MIQETSQPATPMHDIVQQPVSPLTLPKPYYDKDGITIYHGDCQTILPRIQNANLCVTDPPYGIGKADWDLRMPIDWFGEILRIIGSKGAAYVFGDCTELSRFQVYWESLGVRWSSRCVWAYQDGPRNQKAWTRKHEDCLVYHAKSHQQKTPKEPSIHADPRWGDERLMGDVWNVPRVLGNYAERVDHPSQKPFRLIELPIIASSDEGDTVIDPFLGSGTTLFAARELGRKAIGIEREEKYCEIAADRLRQGVLF